MITNSELVILKVSNNFKFIYMQDVFNEWTLVELILYETKMAIFSGKPGPLILNFFGPFA